MEAYVIGRTLARARLPCRNCIPAGAATAGSPVSSEKDASAVLPLIPGLSVFCAGA